MIAGIEDLPVMRFLCDFSQQMKRAASGILPDLETDSPFSCSAGEVAGFSLHAGVATKANERTKLERLCRYITRPAVSTKRLTLTRNGQLRYELNQE
jgi:hypothetical protein